MMLNNLPRPQFIEQVISQCPSRIRRHAYSPFGRVRVLGAFSVGSQTVTVLRVTASYNAKRAVEHVGAGQVRCKRRNDWRTHVGRITNINWRSWQPDLWPSDAAPALRRVVARIEAREKRWTRSQ